MKKTVKKDHILSVRFSDDFVKVLRHVASCHDCSVGSVVRRVVRSYFVSKGFVTPDFRIKL